MVVVRQSRGLPAVAVPLGVIRLCVQVRRPGKGDMRPTGAVLDRQRRRTADQGRHRFGPGPGRIRLLAPVDDASRAARHCLGPGGMEPARVVDANRLEPEPPAARVLDQGVNAGCLPLAQCSGSEGEKQSASQPPCRQCRVRGRER